MSQNSDISRPVIRMLAKVKTSMRRECDLNLRSSCMRLCIRGECVCRYVSRIHARGTYVSDSSRQLDGIDTVAHPSRCCYAYKQVHPHIKGDGGCSFVFPRYESGLPEQLLCVRYRSEFDIVRDLDRRYW